MNKQINKLLAEILSLSVIFSMGVTASAENAEAKSLYSETTGIYASTSSEKIAISDIYLMDTEDMSFSSMYNPATLRNNSPEYCGLRVNLTKQADITLSMTATSKKVALLFVDSNGNIKGRYDYTGKTDETGQIVIRY